MTRPGMQGQARAGKANLVGKITARVFSTRPTFLFKFPPCPTYPYNLLSWFITPPAPAPPKAEAAQNQSCTSIPTSPSAAPHNSPIQHSTQPLSHPRAYIIHQHLFLVGCPGQAVSHGQQHLPQAPVQRLQVGLSQDGGQRICGQRLPQHVTQPVGLGGQQLQPQVSRLLDAARDEEGELSIGGASPQQQIWAGGSPVPAALLEGGQDRRFIAGVCAEAGRGEKPIRMCQGGILARLEVFPHPFTVIAPPYSPALPATIVQVEQESVIPKFLKGLIVVPVHVACGGPTNLASGCGLEDGSKDTKHSSGETETQSPGKRVGGTSNLSIW